jgi:hypothetical protein
MQIDTTIDAFVARQVAAGRAFTAIPDAPWMGPFEASLPYRLPPLYRSLVRRYSFEPFEMLGISFFGNRGGQTDDDLVVASSRDPVLARVSRRNGFIQIGRPATRSYDPVCFDLGRRMKNGDAPLVSLDHEELLIREQIRIVHQYTASFQEAL